MLKMALEQYQKAMTTLKRGLFRKMTLFASIII